MASISKLLDTAFRSAIHDAFGLDADPLISASANTQFGDYQSNVAMSLAKRLAENTGGKANPRQIAEQIIARLQLGKLAAEPPTIAGPGFINIKLSPAWLVTAVAAMNAEKSLGIPRTALPQTIVVDYSAPNVAKEMHVGHLRSTIIGDCFVRILEASGHKVIRQNHIGDWGTQFGRVMLGLWYDSVAVAKDESTKFEAWIKAAMKLAKGPDGEPAADKATRIAAQNSTLQEIAAWHQSAVDDDPTGQAMFRPYLAKHFPTIDRLQLLYQFASAVAEFESAKTISINHPTHGPKTLASLPSYLATFVQKQHEPANQQEAVAWKLCVDTTIRACQAIYERLGVKLTMNDVRGESFYNPMLPEVVKQLLAGGIATMSDGAAAIFIDGFEAPLIIQKTDGGFGYATTDLAAIRFRVGELKASRIIYVVGTPQTQHFQQVFAAARKAGWDGGASLEHTSFGSVLGEDGKLFRTRSGGTVRLIDLLDEAEQRALTLVNEKNEAAADARKLSQHAIPAIARAVGIGAVKYFDLLRDRIGDYKFSFNAMLAMDGNTAPYLQYAHARIASVFRKAGDDVGTPNISQLTHPAELALAKQLLRFGETVEAVAADLKPHVLCTYLYELAGRFSGLYENCPILDAAPGERASRLALCNLTARTLAMGLDLLGIEHPEQM